MQGIVKLPGSLSLIGIFLEIMELQVSVKGTVSLSFYFRLLVIISLRNFAYFGISFKASERGIFNSNFLKVSMNLVNLCSSSFVLLCLKGKGSLRTYLDMSTMGGCSTCFSIDSSSFFSYISAFTSSISTSCYSFLSASLNSKL